MNTKLVNVLRYQHQKFDGLTDPVGLEVLRKAFIKLRPLEDDISMHPEATIDYLASGNLFITGMSDELLKKVSELLSK